MRGTRGRVRRAAAGGLVVLVALGLTTACEADSSAPSPSPSDAGTGVPVVDLSIGVVGDREELSAYTSVTDTFDSLYDAAQVDLQPYPSDAALMAEVENGNVPDVFMASRDDLAQLLEMGVTQPVDGLLDERGVDFGDGYSRDALQAFSVDNRLQCMPYAISPMVMYYNTEIVDFARMERRGLPVPSSDPPTFWGFDVFSAAVQFASRPGRQGTRGIYIDPTLRDLSPMIYSGGGQLFDDDDDPTSLALADSSSREALERWLELLRSPQLTLSPQQLEQHTPLEWFERGKLAMVAGYRDWVPRLRQVHGLDFDVIAMPILEQSATVGDVVGLCLSKDAASTPAAADLMVHMLSTPSVQRVTLEGYIVPANLEVALSDDFLQPGRLPDRAVVFNNAVRAIDFPPLITTWDELEATVADDLQELIDVPILDDLDVRLEEIDEKSRPVLDPESVTPSDGESSSSDEG